MSIVSQPRKPYQARIDRIAAALGYQDRAAMINDMVARYENPQSIAAYLETQGHRMAASGITRHLREAGYVPVEIRRIVVWRKA